jgi:molybdate transport system ATP-binding protein
MTIAIAMTTPLLKTQALLLSLSQRNRIGLRCWTRCQFLTLNSAGAVTTTKPILRHAHGHSSALHHHHHLDNDSNVPELVQFQDAVLSYPDSDRTWHVNLSILPPTHGGHVLLGPNGIGKTLIGQALHHPSRYIQSGKIAYPSTELSMRETKVPLITHVSFQSHQTLVARGGTVFQALTPHGGILNKAAQFLVVRFGLLSMLHRNVRTLSTGEIRKVLLIRALVQRPALLILDNAFDGLDVPSRERLQQLVQQTLVGFRQDILVQGVHSRATAHTQILLITHRAEEMVPAMQRISYWKRKSHDTTTIATAHDDTLELVTEDRQDRAAYELLHVALTSSDTCTERMPMPSDTYLWEQWWKQGSHRLTHYSANTVTADRTDNNLNATDTPFKTSMQPLIQTQGLHLQKGQAVLLQDLTWTVNAGQRWWVAGGNGQGKSTLSRLLVHHNTTATMDNSNSSISESNTVEMQDLDSVVSLSSLSSSTANPLQVHLLTSQIGWVSTELHMSLAQCTHTVLSMMQEALTSILHEHDSTGNDIGGSNEQNQKNGNDAQDPFVLARYILGWEAEHDLWQRPFHTLSQGQQKLVLLAVALTKRPTLLILDEPCQGLDAHHRTLLLNLVNRLCETTPLTLIYSTHHPEEVMPSVDHVLHLVQGRAAYMGSRSDYHPE